MENEYLKEVLRLEDLAEKKAKIYSRLLMDSNLAQKMEELSSRHTERKIRIEKLLFGNSDTEKKMQKEGGRVASKGGEEGK